MIWRCFAVVILIFASCATAQKDARILTDDWADGVRIEATAELTLFPRSELSSGGSTQFSQFHSQGRVRLDPTLPLSPTFGFSWTHFEFSPVELSPGKFLPGQLDDAAVEFATPLAATDRSFFGLAAGIGYAGDDAFGHSDAIYAKADALAGFSLGHDRFILLDLNYDGNRTLLPDVPILYVEYSASAGTSFDYVIGFPLSEITWHATDRLDLLAKYDVPVDVEVEARYTLAPRLSAFIRYFSDDEAFHVEHLNADRRMFVTDQRAELGLTFKPWKDKQSSITALLGYGFDRQFQIGFDDRRTETVARLEDQFYLGVSVMLTY